VNVTGPSAAIPAAAPDWAAQREDLLCPLCEYNLRGLTDPRCPECGYRFDWDQLRDEKLKTHPYLFEHHPERNAWSFRKTATGCLRRAVLAYAPPEPTLPAEEALRVLGHRDGVCVFGRRHRTDVDVRRPD
jgi:hypothetical protein